MKRSHALTAVVVVSLVALGGIAAANPPNAADVDACNEEAAAAESTSASASPRTITETQSNTGDQTNSAATSSDESKRDRATPNVTSSSAAARQAFAACLARHGYYKGYYHH